MKISKSSLYHGVICAGVILIAAIIINYFYPLDSLITAFMTSFGAIAPGLLEHFSNAKEDNIKTTIIMEINNIKDDIDDINKTLEEQEEKIDGNEINIVEISAQLGCYNLQDIRDDINNLKISCEVLKNK